jgi:hypothetical protein
LAGSLHAQSKLASRTNNVLKTTEQTRRGIAQNAKILLQVNALSGTLWKALPGTVDSVWKGCG